MVYPAILDNDHSIQEEIRLARGLLDEVESGEFTLDTALTIIGRDIKSMRKRRSYLRKLIRTAEKNLGEVEDVLRDLERIHKDARTILKRGSSRRVAQRGVRGNLDEFLWPSSFMKDQIKWAREHLANIQDGVDVSDSMKGIADLVEQLRWRRSNIEEAIRKLEGAIEALENGLRVMLKIQKQAKGMASRGGRASYRRSAFDRYW